MRQLSVLPVTGTSGTTPNFARMAACKNALRPHVDTWLEQHGKQKTFTGAFKAQHSVIRITMIEKGQLIDHLSELARSEPSFKQSNFTRNDIENAIYTLGIEVA